MQENVPLTSGDELGALLIDNIPVRDLLLNFCPSPSACNGSFVYWSLRLHTHGHIEFLFYGLVLCWLCRELSIENPLYKAASDVFYGDSVYSGNLTYSVYTNSCINKAIERERERVRIKESKKFVFKKIKKINKDFTKKFQCLEELLPLKH